MAEPSEKELEYEALLALLGHREAPERAIAKILRSKYDLNPAFRAMLADAFEGKNGPISLRLVGTSAKKIERATGRWEERIKRGRAIEHLVPNLGYVEAVEAVAKQAKVSKKTAEADLTLARKASRWAKLRTGIGLASQPQLKDRVFATALANAAENVGEEVLFAAADEIFDQIIIAAEEAFRR